MSRKAPCQPAVTTNKNLSKRVCRPCRSKSRACGADQLRQEASKDCDDAAFWAAKHPLLQEHIGFLRTMASPASEQPSKGLKQYSDPHPFLDIERLLLHDEQRTGASVPDLQRGPLKRRRAQHRQERSVVQDWMRAQLTQWSNESHPQPSQPSVSPWDIDEPSTSSLSALDYDYDEPPANLRHVRVHYQEPEPVVPAAAQICINDLHWIYESIMATLQ
ncbi:unnamed protein product [Sympodiomycopsis kandeliae]